MFPNAIAPDRSEIDLSQPGLLHGAMASIAPSSIVNCAAYTAVDRAEAEEALATTVNGEAVGVLASYAAEAGVPFVTFSTDYVFDGTAIEPYVEETPVMPINAYGRSKRAGEVAALDANPEALVVRTSWLISGTHGNFVATMLRLAAERSVDVVDDQVGLPTIASDLVVGTLQAMRMGVHGILHLANEGPTTWYGLARHAVTLVGIDPRRVRPCSTADFPTDARRPTYSVLGSSRAGPCGLEPLPTWRDSLPAVVAEQMVRL